MSESLAVFVPKADDDAHDLRTRGAWTRSQAAKNGLVRLVVRALLSLADRVPARLLLLAGRAAGHLAHRVLGRERRTARHNLERLYAAEEAGRLARESFVHAGENLAACLLLRRPETRPSDFVHVAPEDLAVFAQVLEPGRGAVFVSAHQGPFEHVPAAVKALGFAPVCVVRESYDPGLDSHVDAHRLARGVGVIHRGRPGAATSIVRALREGRPVGFLPDLGSRAASIEVPFLGVRAAFPIGPQQIAQRVGCRVLVGVLVRRAETAGTSGTAGKRAPFSLRIDEIPTHGTVAELTARVANALEARLLESPADYLWAAPRKTADCGRALGNATLVR